ncbi:hypothetical protein [Alkalibacter mobilis]|uniref:hypothetical protein n=1 Tax=Alkalibacter mobilis TaxID=2787712 RepID=UPI00189EEA10|nr:hypothetical protein [Alkalibacter mobilis]MBF7097205.1 hypothetical protein [Alkalibacter mobilis]
MEMNNIGEKLKSFVAAKKVWVVIVVAALLISAAVMAPMIINRIKFNELGLEKTKSVTFLTYSKDPFSSSVISSKILGSKGKSLELSKAVMNGRIPLYKKGTKGRELLFFHLKDGKSVSAYVDGEWLGFNYGRLWIEAEGLDTYYKLMEEEELVEIKELTYE